MNRLLIACLTIVFLSSCEDTDDNMNIIPSTNTALIYAETTPELSIFLQALERTGLNASLSQRNEITVLAPTNAAFDSYFIANGIADVTDIPVPDLRALLLYHLLNDEFLVESIQSGYLKTRAIDTNVNLLDIFVENDTELRFNGVSLDSGVPGKDVDNGFVYVIESVLALPTLETLVTVNPALSNLTDALVQEGLTTVLATNDGTLDPFTLLAASNEGFQNFIDADPMDAFNDVNDILALTNLSDILQFHVISGEALRSEDLEDGDILNPITMGEYTIDASGSPRIVVNGIDTAGFTTTDITAINGVIHLIDNILLP
jgi:uncharacterized surface protein with fasciclin (FAS1) repeats